MKSAHYQTNGLTEFQGTLFTFMTEFQGTLFTFMKLFTHNKPMLDLSTLYILDSTP